MAGGGRGPADLTDLTGLTCQMGPAGAGDRYDVSNGACRGAGGPADLTDLTGLTCQMGPAGGAGGPVYLTDLTGLTCQMWATGGWGSCGCQIGPPGRPTC